MGNCPSGLVQSGPLCYPPCREGYEGVGPVCWGTCPENTTEALATCQKKSYTRGAGVVPDQCPADRPDKQAGLCYHPCPENYTGGAETCHQNCPPGFPEQSLIACSLPATYGRGAGHTTKEGCERSKDHGAKTNGCEKAGAFWYPRCDPGFHVTTVNFCAPSCPHGFDNIAVGCLRPTTNRGPGQAPNGCPADKPDHDGGFCYPECDPGYAGKSFVCWATCPEGYHDTGADCTRPSYGRGAGVPTQGWFQRFWWILVIIGIIILVLVFLPVIISFFSIFRATSQR